MISYELREDHHEQAAANIAQWYEGMGGKPDNLELRIGNIFDGIPERDADRMVLDLPEPWRAIGTATASPERREKLGREALKLEWEFAGLRERGLVSRGYHDRVLQRWDAALADRDRAEG